MEHCVVCRPRERGENMVEHISKKEEEKYYYRLKGFNTLIDKYLARGKISHSFYLVSQYEKEDYNTQFTDKYFETFPEDIKSHNWEKIKVERDN